MAQALVARSFPANGLGLPLIDLFSIVHVLESLRLDLSARGEAEARAQPRVRRAERASRSASRATGLVHGWLALCRCKTDRKRKARAKAKGSPASTYCSHRHLIRLSHGPTAASRLRSLSPDSVVSRDSLPVRVAQRRQSRALAHNSHPPPPSPHPRAALTPSPARTRRCGCSSVYFCSVSLTPSSRRRRRWRPPPPACPAARRAPG